MLYRALPLVLAVLALAVFVGAPILAEEAAAKGGPREATVKSVSDGKLTVTGKSGKEHDVAVADDAKISCDGKDCKLADLKAGCKVKLTMKDKKATVIEATSAPANAPK